MNSKFKFLLLVPIIAFACNTVSDHDNFLTNSGLPTLERKTLKFENLQDYEDFIEGKRTFNLPEFESLKYVIRNQTIGNNGGSRLNSTEITNINEFIDSKLVDILDSDGFLIIDEYLIKLDFGEKRAYATKDFSLREEILSGIINIEKVVAVNFEDDLLYVLFEEKNDNSERTSTANSNARLQTGCTGMYPPGSNFPPMEGWIVDNGRKCQWERLFQEGGWEFKAEAKHAYQPAAVYFRLKSEVEQYRRNIGSTFWNTHGSGQMKITYWGSYTPKNRSTVPLSQCFEACEGCSPPPVNMQKVQKIHHESTRSLSQYNLFGIYDVFLGGGDYGSGYLDVFQMYNIQK